MPLKKKVLDVFVKEKPVQHLMELQFQISYLLNEPVSLLEIIFKRKKNSSYWSIDEILLGSTTPGPSGPGSNGSERVLHFPQSSRTGASSSDCLVSYLGLLL